MHTNFLTTSLLLLLWASLSLMACQDTKTAADQTNTTSTTTNAADDLYLPALLSGIQLSQVKAAVLGARPKANRVNTLVETPYESYTEELIPEGYTSAYYDFDRVEPQRLVRLRLLHSDAEALQQTIKAFGGTLTDSNTSIYSRTLSDKSTIYAHVKNREVMFYLKGHEPAFSKTRER